MKLTITKFLMTAALITAALPTNAQDSYWGADVAFLDVVNAGVNNIQGIYGKPSKFKLFNEQPLNYEFRGSIGVSDDNSIKLDYHVGAYLRQNFKLQGSKIEPYVVLGLAHAKASSDFGEESETKPSYGIGMQYEMSNGYTINFEYVLQLVENVDGFTIGVRF